MLVGTDAHGEAVAGVTIEEECIMCESELGCVLRLPTCGGGETSE